MSKSYLLLPLALGLAACNQPADVPRAEFGEAVRNNMAQHIVNPDVGESRTLPPAEGVRRSLMIGRYQIDEVEEPSTLQTTPTGDTDEE